MPHGATQSPIACRAAPRFLSVREIASVERLPIDRMTVSTPSMRQLLRQAGWQGAPFLGVKLADPTWTRERWDQAQATLAQWQQLQA